MKKFSLVTGFIISLITSDFKDKSLTKIFFESCTIDDLEMSYNELSESLEGIFEGDMTNPRITEIVRYYSIKQYVDKMELLHLTQQLYVLKELFWAMTNFDDCEAIIDKRDEMFNMSNKVKFWTLNDIDIHNILDFLNCLSNTDNHEED